MKKQILCSSVATTFSCFFFIFIFLSNMIILIFLFFPILPSFRHHLLCSITKNKNSAFILLFSYTNILSPYPSIIYWFFVKEYEDKLPDKLLFILKIFNTTFLLDQYFTCLLLYLQRYCALPSLPFYLFLTLCSMRYLILPKSFWSPVAWIAVLLEGFRFWFSPFCQLSLTLIYFFAFF